MVRKSIGPTSTTRPHLSFPVDAEYFRGNIRVRHSHLGPPNDLPPIFSNHVQQSLVYLTNFGAASEAKRILVNFFFLDIKTRLRPLRKIVKSVLDIHQLVSLIIHPVVQPNQSRQILILKKFVFQKRQV
jgi:hypothetical protein